MQITTATIEDIPALVALINSAYRGESSKKGWTTEADLLLGELRTDEQSLGELLNKPGSMMLKYSTDNGHIAGCVFLQQHDRGLYLGMLTVSPDMQAGGIGRKMVRAAEDLAAEKNCPAVYMNVISLRSELIAWYERLGYEKTGETKPMPADHRFGVPVQPLEFVIMEKRIPVSN